MPSVLSWSRGTPYQAYLTAWLSGTFQSCPVLAPTCCHPVAVRKDLVPCPCPLLHSISEPAGDHSFTAPHPCCPDAACLHPQHHTPSPILRGSCGPANTGRVAGSVLLCSAGSCREHTAARALWAGGGHVPAQVRPEQSWLKFQQSDRMRFTLPTLPAGLSAIRLTSLFTCSPCLPLDSRSAARSC